MSVLFSIIDGVREDLAARRLSLNEIQENLSKTQKPILPNFPPEGVSVIAEVKRTSPSKGDLAKIENPADLAKKYEVGGASAVSVLTEQRRFKGSLSDFDQVRSAISIPMLRKDFMIDEYQFYEARAHGADLILLIVAAISKSQLNDYYELTKELGMQALVEVHNLDELEDAMEIDPEIIGVNSRNLNTLEVDSSVFAQILPRIPKDKVRVAESGISSKFDVQFASNQGANVILVGEALVKSGDPIATIKEFKS